MFTNGSQLLFYRQRVCHCAAGGSATCGHSLGRDAVFAFLTCVLQGRVQNADGRVPYSRADVCREDVDGASAARIEPQFVTSPTRGTCLRAEFTVIRCTLLEHPMG